MIDPGSFEEYVAARRDVLVRVAFLLTGDAHTAEDVVQASLARVWPRWSRLAREGDVDAYVRRTLYTVFVTAARRRRWREVIGEPGNAAASRNVMSDASTHVEDRLTLDGIVRTLPPRQRAVIVLRYYLDLSEADTAATLGCAVGTVKSQHAKAMRHLRTLIEPHQEYRRERKADNHATGR